MFPDIAKKRQSKQERMKERKKEIKKEKVRFAE
jgi:hypothetical protein